MKLLIFIFCCCLAVVPLVAAEGVGGHAKPFLSFQWSGGHSPYRKVTVEIQQSGGTEVRIDKQGKPAFSYRTDLSKEEMGALSTLIASTQFFSQQDQNATPWKHTGETEIAIVKDKETKTLSFRHLPALDPLSQFVWKLVAQADALSSIESDSDIYTASGVVNPRLAGAKVLQPDQFREPLSAYVRKSGDRQKISWALESLAWITTPEAFAGLIANEVINPKRRDLMLLAIPEHGNLPEPHWKALCPFYLDFIQKNHSHEKELTAPQNAAYETFVRSLAVARYEPSIPLFVRWFEEHDRQGMTPDITPLAMMGLPGLQVLIPYLDSSEEAKRGNAIELLTIAARGNPGSKYAYPFSDAEYAAMIPVFEKTILPRLSEVMKTDTSLSVRKLAADAIPEIRTEIEK